MSNFSFLTHEWASMLETAQKAEQYALTEPTVSAILCRKAMEEMVTWLFDHDSDLELPDKTQIGLNDLLWEASFKRTWGQEFGKDLHVIRRTGNDAAHKNIKIPAREALSCIKLLYRFTFNVVRTFSTAPPSYQPFDENLIAIAGSTLSSKEVEKIRKEAEQKSIDLERRLAELSTQNEELERIREQLAHYKQLSERNGDVAAPAVLSESETPKLYIDVLLRQSGWNVEAPQVQEFAVRAMDEATGTTHVLKADYVLWGNDGKPLAVIEAKRTTAAVERGRNQAKNYADALEAIYGQRPVIFYTNGYDTYLWDDHQYPPRKVYGFLSAEELLRLMVRRKQRKSLRGQKINQGIANRYYQERAIRCVAERYEEKNQRRALLVMATGTGKTRVSAAIVDMLTKAQWAKRILFLADRNALVTQSLKNYNEYLPSLPGIDLTKEEDKGSARVVFSTYQTTLNRIDTDYRNGKRFYGIGHFDLIIIDEAHRSVYDKYGAIFEYFDALYLGLTATPKDETDRDTYALFQHAPGEPTDAYEYETAVADGFLVPLRIHKLQLKFPSQGIRYTDLSEEEKREWERKFYDPETGQILDEIDSGAINNWLFNESTVDKVLQTLMDMGQKVEGNEKLGKTIIFARNHRHAEFILERFYALYPYLSPHFAQVIDNYAKDAEECINQFKLKDKYPQIAISVDMLDTGIDVPEIVNLVFFKPVYSVSKFWQMLGRGTRLCRNLFGPDKDKEDFFVFDVCGVFDYFNQNSQGIIPGKSISLSEATFLARAELVLHLQSLGNPDPESEDAQLAKDLSALLQRQINDLDTHAFEVALHLRQVERYGKADAWQALRAEDIRQLAEHVAPLVHDDETHERVKRLDLLMVRLQLAILRSEASQAGYVEKLQVMARELLRKADTVPTIARKKDSLKQLLDSEFWAAISTLGLERIRMDIRELSKLLDVGTGKEIFYTNFTDELVGPPIQKEFKGRYGNFESHYARLKKIIQDNANHLTIHRLYTNQPITATELDELDRMLFAQSGLEAHAQYQQILGEKPLGVFVRSILGLDASAVQSAFSSFLSNGPLTSVQIEFINNLIQQFTRDGQVDPGMLFEQPYNRYHESGVAGVFPLHAEKLLEIVEETNGRAMRG